jgi:hypothetical protein
MNPTIKDDPKAVKLYMNFVKEFFEKNFEQINYDLSDSEMPTEKSEFLKAIGEYIEDALWAEQELARWGMAEPNMLNEYRVFEKFDSEDNYYVLKIGKRHVRLTGFRINFPYFNKWVVTFAKRKVKTIKVLAYE